MLKNLEFILYQEGAMEVVFRVDLEMVGKISLLSYEKIVIIV